MTPRLRRTVATYLLVAGMALGATAPSTPPVTPPSTPVPTSDCASEATTDTGAPDEGPAWLRALPPDEPVVAVAVHDGPPLPATIESLRALGLAVQPLRHLPFSIVLGDPSQLLQAGNVAGVRDLRPDRPLELHSRTSTAAIGAGRVWSDLGVTGEGVGVAVVDTGVDATHPAFEDRVERNVKIVGPSYLGLLDVPIPATVDDLVLVADEGPYSNTDTHGHGTHVAGIVAADDVGGDEEDSPAGVAPGAHLVAYSVGELWVVTALAAFDDILQHREDYAIRVVNNSWGDRFSIFDPGDPINIATRFLHDAGLVVTFPAGNSAEEMTLNPFAVAPWVVGVGSASPAGQPSLTSSGGLRYDNAAPGDRQAHARFDGDRLGIYHPDVLAPGEAILSTATPTGPLMGPGPHPPGGTARASGTSMASPHVAGIAALLLQAQPDLTPAEIERVLEVTATPVPGQSLWRSGFGAVDALRAVTLVTSDGFSPDQVAVQHQARTAELVARRDRPVRSSDHWALQAGSAVAVGNERHCLAFVVDAGTSLLRATTSFAGTGDWSPMSLPNHFAWSLIVRDAAGTVVGRSATSKRTGVSTLEVELHGLDDAPVLGTWTAELVADTAATVPRPLYSSGLSVVVTQLGPVLDHPSAPEWELPLVAGTETMPTLTSAEGCAVVRPGTGGTLGGDPARDCRATNVGVVWTDVAGVSTFLSDPLDRPMTLSGTGTLVLHLADEAHPAWGGRVGSRVLASVEVLPPDGAPGAALASLQEPALVGPAPVRGTYELAVAPMTLPSGSRLRLRVEVTGLHASWVRLLQGGPYDSGLTLDLSAP